MIRQSLRWLADTGQSLIEWTRENWKGAIIALVLALALWGAMVAVVRWLGIWR